MKHGAVSLLVGLGALLLVLSVASETVATPVQVVHYQGRLVDSNGVPLEQPVERLTFRLYSTAAPTSASFVWGEVHLAVPIRRGVFTVLLGGGSKAVDVDGNETDGANPLGGVAFNGSRYLEVQVGDDAPLSPLTPITSVPHAILAEGSRGIFDASGQNYLTLTELDGRYVLRTNPDGSAGSAPLADALRDPVNGGPVDLPTLDQRYAVAVGGPGGSATAASKLNFTGSGVTVSTSGDEVTVNLAPGFDWNTHRSQFPGWTSLLFCPINDGGFFNAVQANGWLSMNPSLLWSYRHLAIGGAARAVYALDGDWSHVHNNSGFCINMIETVVRGSSVRLYGACDDFVHVFVNNTRVFDSRNPPTGFSYSTTVSLPAGDVRLALIFVDGGGFQDFSLRSQVFEQPGIVYREKPTSAP